MRGRDMDMAQPALDDVKLRARAEETHGGRVSKRVRAHLLFCQAGAPAGRCFRSPLDEIVDAQAGERHAVMPKRDLSRAGPTDA